MSILSNLRKENKHYQTLYLMFLCVLFRFNLIQARFKDAFIH